MIELCKKWRNISNKKAVKRTCNDLNLEVIRYFDKIFVRTYFQYKKWNEKSSPGLYSLLVISLFQNMNLMFFYFSLRSLIERDRWTVHPLNISISMFAIFLINYVRIYKVVGKANLLHRYEAEGKRKVAVHPVLYFLISIGLLVLIRLIGWYPHVG